MLLRAMLLQMFYSIRSERQLMGRLAFDLLFCWFVGLGIDDQAWDHSSFTRNRDRLLAGGIAAQFLAAVLAQPRVRRLPSSDHFSVDGTLIEAWASIHMLQAKNQGGNDQGKDPPPSAGGRNVEVDFRGQTRSNETHASTTDREARLYRKSSGMEAKLCFIGHTLMENRWGLIVDNLAACPAGSVLADPFNQPGPKPAGQVMMSPGRLRFIRFLASLMPAGALATRTLTILTHASRAVWPNSSLSNQRMISSNRSRQR
ncbi:hypothetical protein ASF18_03030 [Methylobacterium sp. Leaf89]|nr:hypothetical protein ASF18_03030 [Methylobacterium sp. Leaf89]